MENDKCHISLHRYSVTHTVFCFKDCMLLEDLHLAVYFSLFHSVNCYTTFWYFSTHSLHAWFLRLIFLLHASDNNMFLLKYKVHTFVPA